MPLSRRHKKTKRLKKRFNKKLQKTKRLNKRGGKKLEIPETIEEEKIPLYHLGAAVEKEVFENDLYTIFIDCDVINKENIKGGNYDSCCWPV